MAGLFQETSDGEGIKLSAEGWGLGAELLDKLSHGEPIDVGLALVEPDDDRIVATRMVLALVAEICHKLAAIGGE